MENFEKCTVAMLGGPCSQHVTGNTSRQNQPQSAIIINMYQSHEHPHILHPVDGVCWSVIALKRAQLKRDTPLKGTV